MNLIGLDVEGFMRVRAVHLRPDPSGGLVLIGGNNAQGKTSVIDAILVALKGGRSIPERPIHEGMDAADIRLDLGELVVHRRITAGGPTLHVTTADGVPVRGPQKILDTLWKGVTLDPLEFAEAAPKEQIRMLLSVTTLDVEAWEREHQRIYDARTEQNRETKRLDGVLAKMPMVTDKRLTAEVSVTDLAADLAAARDEQREIAALTAEHQALTAEIAAKQARLAEVSARGYELNARIAVRQTEGRTVPALENWLTHAEESNAAVRQARQREQTRIDREGSEAASHILTESLKALEEQRAAALAQAPLPVQGLAFDESGITLNGIPFAQSSSAERLKVSTAIGMAMNPQLRVILIREGSLLDKDSLALLDEMARSAQGEPYHFFVEVVGTDNPAAVIISDGENTVPIESFQVQAKVGGEWTNVSGEWDPDE